MRLLFPHGRIVCGLRLVLLLMPSYTAVRWMQQPASVYLYHFQLTRNLNQKSPLPRCIAFGRNRAVSDLINSKTKNHCNLLKS